MRKLLAAPPSSEQQYGDGERPREGYNAVPDVAGGFFAAAFFDTDRFRAGAFFAAARTADLTPASLTAVLRAVFLAAALLAAQRLRSASAIRSRPSSEMFDRFFAGLPGPRVPGGRPGPRRCEGALVKPRSAASALSIAVLCRSRSLIIC